MNSTKKIYSFLDDYSEGAHPKILEQLQQHNLLQDYGYGNDSISKMAADLIKQEIANAEAEIHFVSAGTQANLITLAAMLRPYESVIAPASGHIAVHEAGAIEATGHKINTVTTIDGKLHPDQIQKVLQEHSDEHMVKPRAVFISNATEIGTIYNKAELEALSAACRSNQLFLYLDGARLASALAATEADITLSEIANLVDAFYIGGTKNGALLGEAIVLINPTIKENFRFHLKQRGALLAKSRLIGAQFAILFKDKLYLELASHANQMAFKLSEGIKDLGYHFLSHSCTNQVFPILPDNIISKLQQKFEFYTWSRTSADQSAIRLVTSWATPESAIDSFLKELAAIG